jgi:Cu2+-exporting ATPase
VASAGVGVAELPLLISGMDCAACAGPIGQALRSVPGVVSASVQADSHRASVVYDPGRVQPQQLIRAVESAGYGAAPDTLAQARRQRRDENRQALWRLFVAAFLAMQVMMLATPAYVAPPGDLTPEFKRLLDIASALLTLPVLVFGAGSWFRAAWRALRRGRVVMETPVCVGLLAAFVASSAAAWAPGGWAGHEVYFDSIGMFVGVLLAARWWETRARHRAAEVLEATLALRPETAERETAEGAVQTVALAQVVPGDVLRVALGAAFPADGVLLEGTTRADEALLTGESAPVEKLAGDELVAGSLNVGRPVRMRVQRVGADTRLAGIEALVRGALTQRPASAALADAWAAPFLVAVLALAALGGLAWSFIEPTRAVWVAVSVLIVTCPCALAIAVPSTLLAATRGLARRGILVRRLEGLSRLAAVDEVVFDKTGTLTQDSLALAGIRLAPAASALGVAVPAQALALAAQLAAWSQHPRSRVLVLAARTDAPAAPASASAFDSIDEVAGCGVQALDRHRRCWRLGARAWAAPSSSLLAPAIEQLAVPVLVLSCDGEPVAEFDLHEELRADAAAAVAALHRQGVATRLLSGDRPAATQALAARIGIDRWRAAASAADKLDDVAALQRAGRSVAMVGDGFNDAPVLARADVAIAMGHAALAAREHADLVLLADRPGDVALALATARRTLRLVRQNMAWAAAYNAACIPMALLGWLPPWAAGIGMALSSVLVVANAQRAARWPAVATGSSDPTREVSVHGHPGGPAWKASTC